MWSNAARRSSWPTGLSAGRIRGNHLWLIFPGDDLFTPFERRRGLPLGNQTSQLFANVYLNDFDPFILREIRPGAYCRYVDDFVLFGDDADMLRDARRRIEDRLAGLRLRLHEGMGCTSVLS